MDVYSVCFYSLHRLIFRVQCEEKALADEIDLLFSFLPFEKFVAFSTHDHFSLSFVSSNQMVYTPLNGLEPYTVKDISIFDSRDSVIITDGYSTFRIEPISGIGIISIHPSFYKKTLSSKLNFFLIGLIHIISHLGFFDLHGAALSNQGLGYLFLGESNSGKSTISISLVRQGWNYASDDSLLITCNGNGVEVLSFRKNFYVDPVTISKYTEFSPIISSENHFYGNKYYLNLDEFYPDRFQPIILPKIMIFTTILNEQKSYIQPISKGKAFCGLLKQSVSIFFNRQAVNEQINILKNLINQCTCYELYAGHDLYDSPNEILKILPNNLLIR